MSCPCCDSKRRKETSVIGVYECQKCGAIFGQCYLGESYELVKPFFSNENIPPERTRYYDLECLGSSGIERRHGWFDSVTGLTVQVG